MTVYKYFIRIAFKYRMIIISYTLLFFTISLLGGSSSNKKIDNFMETRLNIGIIDESNTEISEGLTTYISTKNNILLLENENRTIEELIFLEIVDGVLIIPKGFEEKLINKEKAVMIYRDDRKIESFQIENQVNKYLIFANAVYDKNGFDLDKLNDALSQETIVNILEDKNRINLDVNKWFNFYYNFISYITLNLYISILGFVMMDFKEQGIEDRRKISPFKNLKFNKEIYLGQLSIAIFISSIFIIGSILLKGKYIKDIYFNKYLINTIIFSLSVLSLTFLINNVVKTRFALNGISNVIALGTSFISGVMVPQEYLGESVLNIARFFPTYYFVKINDMNIGSIFEIRYELMMQILFAAVFLLLGLYFSKVHQKA